MVLLLSIHPYLANSAVANKHTANEPMTTQVFHRREMQSRVQTICRFIARTQQLLPHTRHQTGYADKLVLPIIYKYLVRRISRVLQSSNDPYAFNASFREVARIFRSRLRSESFRCCPHDPPEPFVSRVSIDTRMPYHQNVEPLQFRWRTNNAQMRIALYD
jgi:hypothetical protein